MSYDQKLGAALDQVKRECRYRVFADLKRHRGYFPQADFIKEGGARPITVWCSNDYLGMGQHPKVFAAMHEAHRHGRRGLRRHAQHFRHHALSRRTRSTRSPTFTARKRHCCSRRAFVANDATLSTLKQLLPDCVIFSDEKNHASMIAGIRNGGGEKRIFRHNDLVDLERQLQARAAERPKIIAFESVYSMDGTSRRIGTICDLAEKYDAMTYLDEVHAVGMYGPRGGGIAEREASCIASTSSMARLPRALASWAATSPPAATLCDAIRSYAPGFIFTTSLAPVDRGRRAAQIRHLKRRASRTREPSGARPHPEAPLWPPPVCRWSTTRATSCRCSSAIPCTANSCRTSLLDEFRRLCPADQLPDRPAGHRALRLTPTPLHTDADMDRLVAAMTELWAKCPLQAEMDHSQAAE